MQKHLFFKINFKIRLLVWCNLWGNRMGTPEGKLSEEACFTEKENRFANEKGKDTDFLVFRAKTSKTWCTQYHVKSGRNTIS